MEHKEEKSTEFIATASAEGGDVKDATKVLEKLSLSEQPKGVLGTVWSAAGAIAETVQHAVQGTIDAAYHTAERIQHDAETVGTVGGYVAKQVAEKASTVYESVIESKPKEIDIDSFLSSPTDDLVSASKPKPAPASKGIAETAGKVVGAVEAAVSNAGSALEFAAAKTATVYEAAKETASSAIATVGHTVEAAKQAAPEIAAKAASAVETAKETASGAIASAGQALESAKETAAQAASSAISTATQATETAKQAASSAIDTAKQVGTEAAAAATAAAAAPAVGKFELTMDVVAHLQRIADRTGDAILHETARKAHSACAKGLSDAPGVHLVRVTPDQATELVNLAIMTQDHELADFARYCQSVAATAQIGIEPYPGKIQEELAKGRQVLQQQGRVHTGPGYGAAFASVGRAAPAAAAAGEKQGEQPAAAALSQMQLTMDMVAHIQRIADRTGDPVLHDTARKAHSACAKGASDAPGVHLTKVTPDQATELVNLAIRTQDHELANFARYCQSVAATNQLGIEPSPGKIMQEIEKGRQELAQGGRAHTGPGYGAAFASLSRSSSQQSLSRQGSQQSLSRQGSQQSLQQNLSRQGSQQSLQQNLSRQSSQQNISRTSSQSSIGQQQQPQQPLQLTMDVVAHLQRIADRTGDPVLHETARRAHSACAKNLNDSPGVHLTYVTPEQATELVNLAIRTQDHELANFARYCQSVAATGSVGVEPSPGKILQEIEKGRQELAQGGRAHTGPGYGAAFASVKSQSAPASTTTSPSITPAIISPTITPAPVPAQQQKSAALPAPQQKPAAAPETSSLTGQAIQ